MQKFFCLMIFLFAMVPSVHADDHTSNYSELITGACLALAPASAGITFSNKEVPSPSLMPKADYLTGARRWSTHWNDGNSEIFAKEGTGWTDEQVIKRYGNKYFKELLEFRESKAIQVAYRNKAILMGVVAFAGVAGICEAIVKKLDSSSISSAKFKNVASPTAPLFLPGGGSPLAVSAAK